MCKVCVYFSETGCVSRSNDAGFPDTRIAACKGDWYGHIKYANGLCAPGWQVCNWKVDIHMLSKISWNVALAVEGCFAYNAAQDGGRCRECKEELDQVGKTFQCKLSENNLENCVCN